MVNPLCWTRMDNFAWEFIGAWLKTAQKLSDTGAAALSPISLHAGAWSDPGGALVTDFTGELGTNTSLVISDVADFIADIQAAYDDEPQYYYLWNWAHWDDIQLRWFRHDGTVCPDPNGWTHPPANNYLGR